MEVTFEQRSERSERTSHNNISEIVVLDVRNDKRKDPEAGT